MTNPMSLKKAIKAIREANDVYAYVAYTDNEGMYVKIQKTHMLNKLMAMKGGNVEFIDATIEEGNAVYIG